LAICFLLLFSAPIIFGVFMLGSAKAGSFVSPYELVEKEFKERVDLASSSNMEVFMKKSEDKKLLLSMMCANESVNEQALSELRDNVYGEAEGFGKFEIVKLTPLIRIYRIDINGDKAVAYVEQFFRFKVRPRENVRRTVKDLPKDWLVPVDENGAWTSATQNFYTVIMIKTGDGWKIEKFVNSDLGGTEYSTKAGDLFAGCGIEGFPAPPEKGMPLPEEIREELHKSSTGYRHNKEIPLLPLSTTQSPYRRTAANYADSHWNDNYSSTSPNSAGYLKFPDDCTNFISQRLFESGAWQLDWDNNGTVEDPNNPPYSSQEWHIIKLTLNSSYSSCRADNQDYYVQNDIDYIYGRNHSPYGWTEGYMDSALGDVIALDQNNNGTADHVGIVAAFDYYTGTPLVDAHNKNRYHVSWEYAGVLHGLRIDNEYDRF
jgi:hypothetical protein